MMKRQMKFGSLKKLRAFCAVCEEGTMLKAAEALRLSQPTITIQIQSLERELEVELFRRHGPRINVTPEGTALYGLVSPLVQDIDNIKESFSEQLDILSSGELTIAAEDSTLLVALPDSVKKFMSNYPGIRVKLVNMTEQCSRDSVLSEESDLAVTSLLNVPESLIHQPLVSYPVVLITPKEHPLTKLTDISLEDIAEYGMIIPSPQFSCRYLVKMVFALSGANYKVVLEAESWGVIKKYVSLGLGISVVSKGCITETDAKGFDIIDLDSFFPSQSYGIVSKKGKSLSEPALKFIETLKTETL